MGRILFIIYASLAAWLVYMLNIVAAIALIPGFYEPLMIIFQPVMAAIASVVMVGLALCAGLLLKIPALRKKWKESSRWASMLIGISLFLMCCGPFLGLTENASFSLAEGGEEISYRWLRGDVFYFSYFCLIFGITNWPLPTGAFQNRAS